MDMQFGCSGHSSTGRALREPCRRSGPAREAFARKLLETTRCSRLQARPPVSVAPARTRKMHRFASVARPIAIPQNLRRFPQDFSVWTKLKLGGA
eukprot:2674035-Prymnesium_polylepis.2